MASPELPAGKKINWSKHAALSALIGVGLVFGIPPLLRATVGETGQNSEALDESACASPPISDGGAATPTGADITARALPRSDSCPAGRNAVVLTTTIVGKFGRAAVINGRLHREGDRLAIAGDMFRLTRVAIDQVEVIPDGDSSAVNRRLTIRTTSQRDHTK